MKNIPNFITRIPDVYKDEFIRDIYTENLLRSIIAAIVMLIAETIIYIFFEDNIFNTGFIVIAIIIFNLLLLPILYQIYKRIESFKLVHIQAVQFLYLSGMLLAGCALSVYPQNEFVSVNAYIITVFAIAAFFCTPPIESLVMYALVYLVFLLVLPYYQSNSNIVCILLVNTFIMNVLAWILSRLVFRMKILSLTDKKVIEEKNMILNDMVNRDGMTSLFNHNYTYIKLGEEIERARRIGYPLSIIMMDIDNFKMINDKHGHQAGDEVIIKAAQILKDTCRSTDIICRYGGEEFSIIMPDTNAEDASVVAERIRKTVEDAELTHAIHVTVSAGISQFQGESAQDLIKAADAVLYRAKIEGKNRVKISR